MWNPLTTHLPIYVASKTEQLFDRLLHFLIYVEDKMSETRPRVLFLNQIKDLAGAYMPENTQQRWAE